jgi:hypothetical protein
VLISDRHRDLYRDYYASREVVSRPNQWLKRIDDIAERLAVKSILDYGCGAARGISKFSRFAVVDYDPAVPGCDAVPGPADLVVSIHALEHVEPECLDYVLDHMRRLYLTAALIVVSCESSSKTLPDGTPWHSVVRDATWWRGKLCGIPQPTIKTPDKEFATLWLPSGRSV